MNLDKVASVAEALANAAQRDATPHVIDGPRDKATALDAIAAALSFPDYFGRNLDALYDMLTDLSWLPGNHVLIWIHPEAIQGWPAIASTLSDALTRNERLRVQLVQAGGGGSPPAGR
jgi:RNAse (barnase) inhibitor barstar